MPVRRVLNNDQGKTQGENQPDIFSRLGTAAIRGLEAPGETLNTIAQLLGQPKLLQGSPIAERIPAAFGYKPEQLKPKGTLESFGQRALEYIPSTVAFGGGIPNVLATLAGAGAATGAQQLGLSKPYQDVAHLGTELASGRLLNAIPTIAANKNPDTFGGLAGMYGKQKAITEQALESGVKSAPLGEKFNKAYKGLQEAFSTGTDKTRKILTQADRIISNSLNPDGSLDYAKGLVTRQNLDMLLKNAPDKAKDSLFKIRESLNDFLKHNNLANPNYAKSLTKQDRIAEISSLNKQMVNSIQDWTNNLSKGVYSKFLSKPGHSIIGKAGEIGSRFAILAKNDPKLAAEYYTRAIAAAGKRNIPELAGVLTRMEKIADKKAPKATEVKAGKIYRVLS